MERAKLKCIERFVKPFNRHREQDLFASHELCVDESILECTDGRVMDICGLSAHCCFGSRTGEWDRDPRYTMCKNWVLCRELNLSSQPTFCLEFPMSTDRMYSRHMGLVSFVSYVIHAQIERERFVVTATLHQCTLQKHRCELGYASVNCSRLALSDIPCDASTKKIYTRRENQFYRRLA